MRMLPVGATVEHAIKSAVRNFPFAVQASLPWMLVLMPLVIGTNLYVMLNGIAPIPGQPADFATMSRYFLVTLPMLVVQAVAFSSIAVNWHRYILRDEIPQGWERLRFDSLTWRYLGNVILIMVLTGAAVFGVVLMLLLVGAVLHLAIGKAVFVIGVPAYVFTVGWGMTFGQRMSIKLPAVALGRQDFQVQQALEVSRQNAWRIFGVMLLVLLCTAAVSLISLLGAVVFNKLGIVGLSIAFGIQIVVQWICTILGITMLTSLYGFFVEGRDF